MIDDILQKMLDSAAEAHEEGNWEEGRKLEAAASDIAQQLVIVARDRLVNEMMDIDPREFDIRTRTELAKIEDPLVRRCCEWGCGTLAAEVARQGIEQQKEMANLLKELQQLKKNIKKDVD